jgi:hypothetical protein
MECILHRAHFLAIPRYLECAPNANCYRHEMARAMLLNRSGYNGDGKAKIYDQKQIENSRPKSQLLAEGVLVGPGSRTLFDAGRTGPVGQANKGTETGIRCNSKMVGPEYRKMSVVTSGPQGPLSQLNV